MQAGHRARAAIASAIAAVLLMCGLLARHHEAEVAHVRDVRTGTISHAVAIDCHDGSPTTHMHGLPNQHHRDVGTCAILGTSSPISQPQSSTSIAIVLQLEPELSPGAIAAPLRVSLLLVAPKTSPPSIG